FNNGGPTGTQATVSASVALYGAGAQGVSGSSSTINANTIQLQEIDAFNYVRNTLTITATGNLTAGNIYIGNATSTLNASISSTSGTLNLGYIDVSGAGAALTCSNCTGQTGEAGGNITLSAAGNISTSYLRAYGGGGSGSWWGCGGCNGGVGG